VIPEKNDRQQAHERHDNHQKQVHTRLQKASLF